MTDRKYSKDPIIEVVCEFRFMPDTHWDSVIPGLIYERVRDTFSKRRPTQRFGLLVTEDAQEKVPEVHFSDVIQLLRADEKAFLQIGRHLLSVNHLNPYPGWEGFLPLIDKGFRAYRDSAEPRGLQRIGLRYINRIEIDRSPVELAEFFNFRPYVGSDLPQDHGPFLTGVQFPFENSRDTLRLQLTSAEVETADHSAFILDLDYFTSQVEAVPLDNVPEWVDNAHSQIERIFEASITDDTRRLFDI